MHFLDRNSLKPAIGDIFTQEILPHYHKYQVSLSKVMLMVSQTCSCMVGENVVTSFGGKCNDYKIH